MAQRRMFSLEVVDTDNFLDLPTSSQCLYFHLGMRADDDGFVAAPKKIMNITGCSPDDMKLLITKGFVIPFDTGVCVIREWKVNNYIQKDRYHETRYLHEKSQLQQADSGGYMLVSEGCIQNVYSLDTEVRLGKDSIGKDRESKADKPPSRSRFVPPTVEEVRAYCSEKGYTVDPQRFVDYYTSNGWRVGKNPMKDWKAAVRTWNGKEQSSNGKAESKSAWTVGTTV